MPSSGKYCDNVYVSWKLASLRYCSIAQFVRRYPVFRPAGDTERRNRRLHGCAKAKGLITFGSINSKLGDVVQLIASLARYSMVLGSLTTYDGLDRPSSKEIIVITATIRHPVTECILFGPKVAAIVHGGEFTFARTNQMLAELILL